MLRYIVIIFQLIMHELSVQNNELSLYLVIGVLTACLLHFCVPCLLSLHNKNIVEAYLHLV